MKIDSMMLEELNIQYGALSVRERFRNFYDEFHESDVLCTSSFGSNAACLLVYLSKINPRQKIHFIDTGNHFPETLFYKSQLCDMLGLKVETIRASPDVHLMAQKQELWNRNAEYCCHIKKVRPLSMLKPSYSFWLTGLQRWQTANRSEMKIFERQDGIVKFNPLIDMTRVQSADFMSKHMMPQHPLKILGYDSISCTHCTNKGVDREGRWSGLNKTECGLHN